MLRFRTKWTDLVLEIRESFRFFETTRKELSWNERPLPNLSSGTSGEKPARNTRPKRKSALSSKASAEKKASMRFAARKALIQTCNTAGARIFSKPGRKGYWEIPFVKQPAEKWRA
jgi:hypothetical protein